MMQQTSTKRSRFVEGLKGIGISIIVGLLCGAVLAGPAYFVIVMPFPGELEKRALCDRAVDTLVHSDDLVEVTRAGIILREVNCAIGRRLANPQP